MMCSINISSATSMNNHDLGCPKNNLMTACNSDLCATYTLYASLSRYDPGFSFIFTWEYVVDLVVNSYFPDS